MAKEFFPELNFQSSSSIAVAPNSTPKLHSDSILNSKFEFKSKSSLNDEKQTPVWSFHECKEELVTFTEKTKKTFSLVSKDASV